MKKVFVIISAFAFILTLTSPAYCDTALKKLGRGLCNIVTAPVEITHQISKVSNTDGPMAGLSYGTLKGVLMTGVRAVVGAYEVVTFPIPMPRHYKPILTEPEFFFEEKNW